MSASKTSTRSGDSGIAETVAALRAAIMPLGAPVADGPAGGTEAQSQRMCVLVGELHLLIPADRGREVITPPAVSRIPNTAPWLRGVANVRGNLIPVVDLTAALGLQAQASAGQPYVLISGQGDAAMAILIDGLPRLVNLDAAELFTERPPLAAALESAVVSVYRREGQIWIDVDLQILFDTLARRIALWTGNS